MTISTVGYGDISPQNNAERAFVVLGLFLGASFFSYIVGTVCGAPAPSALTPKRPETDA